MSLTAAERETVINLSDADATAKIWSCQRPMIRKLKANPDVTLLREGEHDGSPWAEFSVPARLVAVRRKSTRAPMTPEQQAAARDRLAAARRSA